MTALAIAALLRVLSPCIDTEGRLIWVRGGECPTGSSLARDLLPDACDEGWCEVCPPGGCVGLASLVMCCGSSGEGGCFEIISTTMECPWGHDVLYCEYGWCDDVGNAHCIPIE